MAAVLLLLTLGSSLGHAQVTIYGRFSDGTGVWAGESTAPGRTGWTEVKSVSFGAINPPGATKTSFPPFSLAKNVDILSPQIFANVAGGLYVIPPAGSNAGVTIEFVRTGAAGPVTFFRLELRDALITQTGSSAAASDGSSTENIAIDVLAMRYTSWPILANGSQGTPVVKSWNIANDNSTF